MGDSHERPHANLRTDMTRQKASSGADRAGAIYQALRRAIIEQALEPGAKLPEDTIGERFGVSRTLVRHALGRLAGEGLVELRRNHGAAVAKPSWDEARDIFAVRLGLERLVVSTLAGQLTAEQATRLRRHVKEEETARGIQRAIVDPAGGRVSHPVGGHDGQCAAGALRGRSNVPVRPDPRALRPAALLGVRGERASRHHRRAG